MGSAEEDVAETSTEEGSRKVQETSLTTDPITLELSPNSKRTDNTKGNEGRSIQFEGLGWAKREEVGEEAGGAGRSHGGARDCVSGGVRSDPGRDDI